MSEPMNNSTPSPETRGGKSKLLLGCLLVVGIVILLGLAIGGWLAYKAYRATARVSTISDLATQATTEIVAQVVPQAVAHIRREVRTATAELENNLLNCGFHAGGVAIGGKGTRDVIMMLLKSAQITQPPTQNVYYIARNLSVDAPCAGDVLFIGDHCQVNRPIAGRLLFYAYRSKAGELTIANGVTIGKLVVNRQIKIRGDQSSIKDGIVTDFNAELDLTGLEQKLREQFGDLATDRIKK